MKCQICGGPLNMNTDGVYCRPCWKEFIAVEHDKIILEVYKNADKVSSPVNERLEE